MNSRCDRGPLGPPPPPPPPWPALVVEVDGSIVRAVAGRVYQVGPARPGRLDGGCWLYFPFPVCGRDALPGSFESPALDGLAVAAWPAGPLGLLLGLGGACLEWHE